MKPTPGSLPGALAVAGALLIALGLEPKRRQPAAPPSERAWAPVLRPLQGRAGYELNWIEAQR